MVNEDSAVEDPGPQFANRVYEIQGNDLISPFVGQTVYRVPGIVTASVPGNRFFLQDLEGDGDDSTSDAIEVFSTSTLQVGDVVEVTGLVRENFPANSPYDLIQPTTRILASEVNIVSNSKALPLPVIIGAHGRSPPTENMEDGVAFWESLEGMRVEIQSPVSISSTENGDTLYVLADHGQYATGLSQRGTLSVSKDDFNPERILIMEENVFDLPFPQVGLGTKFDRIVGVIDDQTGNYEVLPTEIFGVLKGGNSRLSPTTTTCREGMYTMSVVTYFVDGSTNYDTLASQIVNNLGLPDVIAMQGLTVGFNFLTLNQRISALIGGVNYEVLRNAAQAPSLAILYNRDRIEVVTNHGIQDQLGPHFGLFTDKPQAALLKFKPLEIEFDLINTVFTDKIRSASITGVNQPFEDLQESDDINGNLAQRISESNAIRKLIRGSGSIVSDPDKVIVAGSLFENEFVSPIMNLEKAALKNLLEDVPDNERYSVIDQGNSQAWDYIFVSDFFCPGGTGEYVHVNTEFLNPISSHDPMVGCLYIS
jgi:hypothetical protein